MAFVLLYKFLSRVEQLSNFYATQPELTVSFRELTSLLWYLHGNNVHIGYLFNCPNNSFHTIVLIAGSRGWRRIEGTDDIIANGPSLIA